MRSDLTAAEAKAMRLKGEAQQARQELLDADARRDEVGRAKQKLADLESRRADIKQQLAGLREQLAAAQESAKSLAVPEAPQPSDVVKLDPKDERPLYLIASTVAIAALFAVALFFTLRGESRA